MSLTSSFTPVAGMQVWVTAALDPAGKVVFHGASDSELTAGVVAVMCEAVSGLTPEEVLQVGGGGGERPCSGSCSQATPPFVESVYDITPSKTSPLPAR